MNIINKFEDWLQEGRNTGAAVQKNSAVTISNQVRRIREKYKNRGCFLETILKNQEDYESWIDKEKTFIEKNSPSEVVFKNSIAYLRAFWRFCRSFSRC